MKHIMESVTYIAASVAVLSLLKTLHLYWCGISLWSYFLVTGIGIVFIGIYLRNISMKDEEWIYKVVLIFSIAIIIATLFFKKPLELIFSGIIGSIGGLATYYNYYRMADYVLLKKSGIEKFQKLKHPEKFYTFFDDFSIEQFLENTDEPLFSILKQIKDDTENGKILLYTVGDTTYIRRWNP